MKTVFESRMQVIDEILHGNHAHNLRGYRCHTCDRLLVRVVTPMLTPFSRPQNLRLPPGLLLDVETEWGWRDPAKPAESVSPPICTNDGAVMERLSDSS